MIFLFTPPFTQLNTPYPATAYLKGFLNSKNIPSFQADLGLEVILNLFSKNGLTSLFNSIEKSKINTYSENSQRIIVLKEDYLTRIEPVISFLQGKNPTLAMLICRDGFLPEASRFTQMDDFDWAFGLMGTQDRAKHLATLFLEDLSDLIIECADPHFGFSRYAEKLGRSANSFDEIYSLLNLSNSFIDNILLEILEHKIKSINPYLVAISVPFPGNLYSAFKSAQFIKKNYPNIKIAMGGGFPNTELRSLSDTRVFEFFDFICLDDGEKPLENLLQFIENKIDNSQLKRTFTLENNQVQYFNDKNCNDYKQFEVGTPDYSDLLLEEYISVIEIVNPMHKMWSDGRWNKLTMAHGCYWGKCTFCDISLDYIKIYEPIAAQLLCDRIEEIILKTGQNGFHFVDEAAPPALMRALALEILRRNITITWWTNIRFEKSFSLDLCKLLKASGCVAVSGGLEVASDRLLELIQKGVTVEQVAQVTSNFTQSGIMVHAYLMYGFPSQTAQETIDSLEMVRQMFELNIIQSGFWHQFALTAHSPVGLNPNEYGIIIENTEIGKFANNDLEFKDLKGVIPDKFSFGLKKSLFNYMHGICFDYSLQEWFDFKIPKTTIPKNYIQKAIENYKNTPKPNSKIVFLGKIPQIETLTINKKGKQKIISKLTFFGKKENFTIQLNEKEANWLLEILPKIMVNQTKSITFQEIKQYYENYELNDFEMFWNQKNMNLLKEIGLLVL